MDVEGALIRLVDVHVAIVVVVVSVILGVREDVPKATGKAPGERRAGERLAEDGQKRQKEHQLADHEIILTAPASTQAHRTLAATARRPGPIGYAAFRPGAFDVAAFLAACTGVARPRSSRIGQSGRWSPWQQWTR